MQGVIDDAIYKNAIAKQTAIVKALKEENDADKERIDYLNGLNVLLQSAIKDLQHDLGFSGNCNRATGG